MLALKTPLKNAQKIKEELIKKGLFAKDYEIKKDSENIYFPIKTRFNTKLPILNLKLKKYEKINVKQKLKDVLSDKEFKKLKTAMDIVGDIAIIEIDRVLEKKAKLIATEILKTNKNMKTVLKKKGGHEGVFRVQKYTFLAGEKRFVTVHKENNCLIKLDVNNVYFSPRLATERKRIATLVKSRENVLVMFSGCAPYCCVISKNTKANLVYGIEINPTGHKYGLENIKLNKLNNVTLIKGDVKKIAKKLNKKFDRILMPLPKGAEDFLDDALSCSKKGTIIHFYDFLKEDEFEKAVEKIKKACEKNKIKFKILNIQKCGQSAPYVFRVCVDSEII